MVYRSICAGKFEPVFCSSYIANGATCEYLFFCCGNLGRGG